MTVFRLALPWNFTTPEDAADYVEFGGRYVEEVARRTNADADDLEERVTNASDAMDEGRTDVDDDVAEVVAAVLVGDAEFYTAFVDWFPLKYRVFGRPLEHVFNPKLRSIAAEYAGDTGVEAIEDDADYSAADDHVVDGRPAMSHVDGVGNRVVLADSVLHVEWYADVAGRLDVDVEEDLVERTVRESPAYFAGARDELPHEVAELQRHLFYDAEWLRQVDEAYELDSWVMARAAEAIDDAATSL